MARAAYIIGMQKIASLASPKKRVVEQGFLEFFQDDRQTVCAVKALVHSGGIPARELVRTLAFHMDYEYNPSTGLDTNDCGLVTYFFRRIHASFQD
jgi:hypothetical protein